ncbi:sigma-70 family RNA polymerase sigma factor [Planomonospora sp. ID82291]|uniref:sigma-70 family RNA polymerase sigma factor n=1 Tax=Planomonospora sp. ID82291 TaxID=2738136 RepID=UPI001E3BC270|nr:sigma-70 family RNA polymerase sigma factor [Planomonospora sp. ID82291]
MSATATASRPARPANGAVDVDPIKDYLRQIGRTPLLTAEQEVELGERIEAGTLAREHLAAAGDALSPAGRRELERRVADGRRARDHMVEANLRLVVSIARRYAAAGGMPLLDLVQEGTIGMMRAVEKFDHRRGLKFSTYATWWIKQAVGRALADQSRTVRLPAHVVEVLNRVTRLRREMSQTLGREATPEELAAGLGLTSEKVEELLRHAREPVSLHLRLGDDGDAELGDLIEDDAPDPADTVAAASLRGRLAAVLATLTEREADVIALRYGLADGETRTLEQIGRRFGVTRERVRQIESAGMRKLRHPARTRALADLLS